MNAVPATRGPIQAAKDSTSGKTLSVQVNGAWFSTKNWDFRNMIGQTIEFVPDISEWQGNTITWINDYSVPALTAADAMNQALAQNNANGATTHQAPPNQALAPATQNRPVVIDGDPMRYLPMTSNLVAHAIQAGLITHPDQLGGWAAAAFAAAKHCVEGAGPSTMDDGMPKEFDDDIPF